MRFIHALASKHSKLLRRKQVHATPFTRLVKQIPASYRASSFRNITLDHRLGFMGSRQFDSLEQALAWAESDRGYSWADKRCWRPLGLNELLCCTGAKVSVAVKTYLEMTMR